MTVAAQDDNGNYIPAFGLGTVQTVAYTGTAGAISNAVGSSTRMVRVWCSTDAHILIAASPTADTNDTPVTGKAAEYFKVRGGIDKVSAVQQSAGGDLYVTELE